MELDFRVLAPTSIYLTKNFIVFLFVFSTFLLKKKLHVTSDTWHMTNDI